MQDKLTEASPHTELRLDEEPTNKKHPARSALLFLGAALLIGGGIFWRTTHKTQTTAAAGARQQDAAARRGVPVAVAAARRQDLPIYLDGLGSVQAINTDTVKSRVDGELVEVDFKEGQDVKKGDLLAVIDPRPYQVALDQAQANLARDQAQLADAKLNAGRFSQLVKDGIIAQQQSDTQGALVAQLQGAVGADQAQIDSAKLNITYSHITSPINGRVGLRLVDMGNIVHAADSNGLLVITQMQPIAVIFTLPEDSLPAVNSRMRNGTPLQVKAYSRDDGTEIASGTLLTIDNQIDQTTGTIRLKAVFNNQDRALWPNQFVNARLLLDVKRGALIIPAAAIQHGSDGTFVYAVKSDNTVEVRPVTVGITEGTLSSVDSGISPGEQVVTDGQDKLRAGSLVEARSDSAPGANAASSVPGPSGIQGNSGQTASPDQPVGLRRQNPMSQNPGAAGSNPQFGQQESGQQQGGRQGFRQGSGQGEQGRQPQFRQPGSGGAPAHP